MTQIDYYTERVKRMVGKVLTGNGITRYDQGAYDLVGGVAEGFCAAVELSDAEREELLQLCRQRLDAFREQRGEEVFTHRSRHRTPISGSIKVRMLTRAKGRCECCGAGCCLANPAPEGPGGGPHRAQEPGRFGRPQQPAGPLLPLQRRHTQRPRPSISASIEQPSWPARSLRICRKVPTLRGFGSASCDFLFDGSPHSHGAAAARPGVAR